MLKKESSKNGIYTKTCFNHYINKKKKHVKTHHGNIKENV